MARAKVRIGEKAKKVIIALCMALFALGSILLAVVTASRGEIYIATRGGGPGWDLSVEKEGQWFFLVPALQASVGVLFFVGAILLLQDAFQH